MNYYIVFDTKNRNTELDTLIMNLKKVYQRYETFDTPFII